jgi:hypothetical protein
VPARSSKALAEKIVFLIRNAEIRELMSEENAETV